MGLGFVYTYTRCDWPCRFTGRHVLTHVWLNALSSIWAFQWWVSRTKWTTFDSVWCMDVTLGYGSGFKVLGWDIVVYSCNIVSKGLRQSVCNITARGLWQSVCNINAAHGHLPCEGEMYTLWTIIRQINHAIICRNMKGYNGTACKRKCVMLTIFTIHTPLQWQSQMSLQQCDRFVDLHR
jgi:hypothetical protein